MLRFSLSIFLPLIFFFFFFFFNDPATTEIYTLSLHDALPICLAVAVPAVMAYNLFVNRLGLFAGELEGFAQEIIGTMAREGDRKSTRLNSSHMSISYAVFCLKKKKKNNKNKMNNKSKVKQNKK